MAIFHKIWALLPGMDDAAKLRFAIVAAGGLGVAWGLVRWLRKEDLGTTTKTILKTQRTVEERAAEERRELRELVLQLSARVEARLAALAPLSPEFGMGVMETPDAIMEDLSAAVQRLAGQGQGAVLEQLAAGDDGAAAAALASMRAEVSKTRVAVSKEEAELAREQGALAFLNDTHEAVRLYAEACKLDPDNPDGWNRLGSLNIQAGDLDGANRCFERVMVQGNSVADQEALACAACNLSKVHLMRGGLDAAQAMQERALALYGRMDHKEGMAGAYGILGKVAEERRDKAVACAMWAKALELFRQVGMKQQIEEVEAWMRKAGCAG